ncbi:hypothetical protein BH09BAC1_BH09BAC1_02640 [soil metagenome]
MQKPSRSNKTPKQILLEIAKELNSCDNHVDVEELLNEAKMLVWMEFDDVDNNILKKEIDTHLASISKYTWQKSQHKKDTLLKNVIDDAQDSIQYYYKIVSPNEK